MVFLKLTFISIDTLLREKNYEQNYIGIHTLQWKKQKTEPQGSLQNKKEKTKRDILF